MGKFFRTVLDLLEDLWVALCKLFRTVFLVDLLQPKYIYTEQYPSERPKVAERYRGAPRLNINPDNGETLCISCNLCALACPENLIVVTSERDEATKRKVLTTFTYDTSVGCWQDRRREQNRQSEREANQHLRSNIQHLFLWIQLSFIFLRSWCWAAQY